MGTQRMEGREMLALITNQRVVIFRRTSAGLERFSVVEGDQGRIIRAIEAAREIRLAGLRAGEWRTPIRLSCHPLDPVPNVVVRLRVLREDGIDS